MSDQMLSFFFAGVFAEVVILLFMGFRRARWWLVKLIIAFFAFYTGIFALFVIGAAFNDPGAFTDGSEIFFPGAFFVLGGLIVAIWRGMPLSAAAPRKRPLMLDVLGCVGLGVLGVVLFIFGIAAMTLLAR